jgi:hypothetical protein
MDIGNQKRVIMVEPVEVPLHTPEPVAEPPPSAEPVGAWPLPLETEPEPAH